MTTVSHTEGSVPGTQTFPPNGEGQIAPAPWSGIWKRIAVTWHAATDFMVPIGYEDETGFHYGEMPASNLATHPDKEAAQKR
jgi:hypothetical protein